MRLLIIGAAIATLTTASTLAADWPQLQNGPGHTGYTPDEPRPPYAVRWVRDLEEPTASAAQPVVAGERVFVGTGRGTLYALDRAGGETAWTYRTGAPIFGTAAVAGDLVYVTSCDRHCHAVRVADGKRAWTFETGAPLWASPVVAEGNVFVAGRDGWVTALDAETGEFVWRNKVPSLVMNTPAYADGVLYVGVGDMRVYAFDAATGERRWVSEKLPGSAMREYWLVAAAGCVITTVDHAVPLRTHWAAMQKEVMQPFIEAHKTDDVLVEDGVFPRLRAYFERHPDLQWLFVLDAATGRQKFIAPLAAVEGGGSTPSPPAVGPDGWAYLVYANIHLSASGNAFFGRLNLATGQVDPLLDGRYAGPAALLGFPGHKPAPGTRWPKHKGDFFGGFCVMDQGWAVSLGGRIAYPVRDPSWALQAPFHNWHDLDTGDGGYVPGDLMDQRRIGGKGVYGSGFHSTVSPMAVAGKDLVHKSPRSVVFCFEGK